MIRARNQYTGTVSREAFVHDILTRRSEPVFDSLGVIACRRGKGPGFSQNSGGYTRVNLDGGKVTVHTTVLEVTAGPSPPGKPDASHLCGNPWCFEPGHLAWEDRDSNIARRGCAGRVLVDGVHWVRVCKHIPECKVASSGTLCEEGPEP
jgi:Zinc-binding loop region of homing endonuclease